MNRADTLIDAIYGHEKTFLCILSNGVSRAFQTHQLAWAYGENARMISNVTYKIYEIKEVI